MSMEQTTLAAPFAFSPNHLRLLCTSIRQKVFQICLRGRTGHIGGCSGAVELLVTLYFGGVLRFFPTNPTHPLRDRVLVRGHLGPVRYPLFQLLGWVEESELWMYRQFGSRLQGHEDHTKLPGVDLTPSGSLGMLLSFGAGAAFAALQAGEPFRTFVFLGDGEEEEGNISEAARHAAHLKLNNLIAIIDANGKQLSNPISETDSANLAQIWRGYGWEVVELKDGHDISSVLRAYLVALDTSHQTGQPTVIIAHTIKGYGLDGAVEHFSGYHTVSTCPTTVIQEGIDRLEIQLQEQENDLRALKKNIFPSQTSVPSSWMSPSFQSMVLDITHAKTTPNHPDMCQGDYFLQLRRLREDPDWIGGRIYFLTADVTRYDQVQQLGLREFCVYLNTGIREQHTIGLAHGISLTDPTARIIINSFDAFMYRWLDQVNAAVQGGSSMVIIADTAGLTNAQNGRTHQSTGQPGAVLALPGVNFLEPWDAEDTFRCLNWAIGESRGVVYLRVHSSMVHVAPGPGTVRTTTSYIVWESKLPLGMTIVASGFPVSSAIQAAQAMEREGVGIRVINLVDHKRSDDVLRSLIVPGRPLLTVYNGNPNVLLQNVARIACTGHGGLIPSRWRGIGFIEGTTGPFQQLKEVYGLDELGVLHNIRELLA